MTTSFDSVLYQTDFYENSLYEDASSLNKYDIQDLYIRIS